MITKKKDIHRGNYLKQIVEDNGASIGKLVRKAGYKDRASYYTHIAKPDLSLEILSAYAKAINYDLRDDFPDAPDHRVDEAQPSYYIAPKSLEEALELIQVWKEKYYLVLEKYTRIIEQKLEKKEE